MTSVPRSSSGAIFPLALADALFPGLASDAFPLALAGAFSPGLSIVPRFSAAPRFSPGALFFSFDPRSSDADPPFAPGALFPCFSVKARSSSGAFFLSFDPFPLVSVAAATGRSDPRFSADPLPFVAPPFSAVPLAFADAAGRSAPLFAIAPLGCAHGERGSRRLSGEIRSGGGEGPPVLGARDAVEVAASAGARDAVEGAASGVRDAVDGDAPGADLGGGEPVPGALVAVPGACVAIPGACVAVPASTLVAGSGGGTGSSLEERIDVGDQSPFIVGGGRRRTVAACLGAGARVVDASIASGGGLRKTDGGGVDPNSGSHGDDPPFAR